MDIRTIANKRTNYFNKFNDLVETPPYDYAADGILTKTLPKILFRGNTVLVTFLQLIDLRLIMMFKYIDRLKRFKWISWY